MNLPRLCAGAPESFYTGIIRLSLQHSSKMHWKRSDMQPAKIATTPKPCHDPTFRFRDHGLEAHLRPGRRELVEKAESDDSLIKERTNTTGCRMVALGVVSKWMCTHSKRREKVFLRETTILLWLGRIQLASALITCFPPCQTRKGMCSQNS